jgi:hypothetical protein
LFFCYCKTQIVCKHGIPEWSFYSSKLEEEFIKETPNLNTRHWDWTCFHQQTLRSLSVPSGYPMRKNWLTSH